MLDNAVSVVRQVSRWHVSRVTASDEAEDLRRRSAELHSSLDSRSAVILVTNWCLHDHLCLLLSVHIYSFVCWVSFTGCKIVHDIFIKRRVVTVMTLFLFVLINAAHSWMQISRHELSVVSRRHITFCQSSIPCQATHQYTVSKPPPQIRRLYAVAISFCLSVCLFICLSLTCTAASGGGLLHRPFRPHWLVFVRLSFSSQLRKHKGWNVPLSVTEA